VSVKLSLLLAASAVVMVAGCASQGARTPGVQRNVVTADELAVVGDVNLQEALTRLRPNFLRGRQPANTGVMAPPVTVYLDGIQMLEGVDHLRQIAAKNVQEVRLLEPQQANARFGGNNNGGALVIATKK
jgi:hypothetical protein